MAQSPYSRSFRNLFSPNQFKHRQVKATFQGRESILKKELKSTVFTTFLETLNLFNVSASFKQAKPG